AVAAQDPGDLAVHQQDAVAVIAGDRRERLDERRVVDRDLASDRAVQAVDLEEVDPGGAENGHAARAACVELTLEVAADPLEIVSQLGDLLVRERVVAKPLLDRVEQRLELREALARSRELARIEIEIEAEDLVAVR